MVPINHSSQSAAGEATEIVCGHEPAPGCSEADQKAVDRSVSAIWQSGHGSCPLGLAQGDLGDLA
jgi:hypothetical protein